MEGLKNIMQFKTVTNTKTGKQIQYVDNKRVKYLIFDYKRLHASMSKKYHSSRVYSEKHLRYDVFCYD